MQAKRSGKTNAVKDEYEEFGDAEGAQYDDYYDDDGYLHVITEVDEEIECDLCLADEVDEADDDGVS